MSEFLSKLVLSPMPDGLQYALQAPFIYQSDLAGKIEVPSGFLTDLASIPKLFWNILPPFGRYSAAAVVHDYLYFFQLTTKEVADSVLREAMVLLGCDALTVDIIYNAVEKFSLPAWQNDTALRLSGYTKMAGRIDQPPYAGIP
jgi:hypothetical protein